MRRSRQPYLLQPSGSAVRTMLSRSSTRASFAAPTARKAISTPLPCPTVRPQDRAQGTGACSSTAPRMRRDSAARHVRTACETDLDELEALIARPVAPDARGQVMIVLIAAKSVRDRRRNPAGTLSCAALVFGSSWIATLGLVALAALPLGWSVSPAGGDDLLFLQPGRGSAGKLMCNAPFARTGCSCLWPLPALFLIARTLLRCCGWCC